MPHGSKVSRDELLVIKDYIAGIISSISDSVIILDPEGKVTDSNPAAADLLGYGQDEMAGKSAADIFSENERPLALGQLLKEDKVVERRVYCRSKRDGKIPVLFSASAMKDKDDNIVFVLCTARDTAGGKEEAANEKPAELKKIQDQLTQAESMEAVRRLASRVAHEIKNPLAIILQCADYLMKRVKTDDENISLTLGHI